MLKKLLCLVLSLMLFLPTLGLAEAAETETEETEEYVAPEELIVTHPTITKGDFFTEMFGNDTADIDVRALIHGYNLVNWDQNQGVYVLDPTVVTDCQVTDDELGNRTYSLVLAEDLYFSDGTPITAWDYAFSLLLMMAPEVEEIGGKIYRAEHLLGYEEYINYCRAKMEGKPDEELMQTEEYAYCLSGVEVLSDHQLGSRWIMNSCPTSSRSACCCASPIRFTCWLPDARCMTTDSASTSATRTRASRSRSSRRSC